MLAVFCSGTLGTRRTPESRKNKKTIDEGCLTMIDKSLGFFRLRDPAKSFCSEAFSLASTRWVDLWSRTCRGKLVILMVPHARKLHQRFPWDAEKSSSQCITGHPKGETHGVEANALLSKHGCFPHLNVDATSNPCIDS